MKQESLYFSTHANILLHEAPNAIFLFSKLSEAAFCEFFNDPANSNHLSQLVKHWRDACADRFSILKPAYVDQSADGHIQYNKTGIWELDQVFIRTALVADLESALAMQKYVFGCLELLHTALPLRRGNPEVRAISDKSSKSETVLFNEELDTSLEKYVGDSTESGLANAGGIDTQSIQQSVHSLQVAVQKQGVSESNVPCTFYLLDTKALLLGPGSIHRDARASGVGEQYTLLHARATAEFIWNTRGRHVFLWYIIFYLLVLATVVTLTVLPNSSSPGLLHRGSLWLLAALTSVDCVSELAALWREKTSYLDLWNLLDWIRLCVVIGYLATHVNGASNIQSYFLAVAVYLTWLNMISLFRPFENTGRFVVMIFAIFYDIRMLLLVMGVCLLAYSNAMTVLAGILQDFGYSSIQASLFTGYETLFFQSYENFLLEVKNVPQAGLAIAIFSLSMFFVSVILLNLLIAILSDSYERVQDSASLEMVRIRASLSVSMEESLFGLLYRLCYGPLRHTHLLLVKPDSMAFIGAPTTAADASFLTMIKTHVSKMQDDVSHAITSRLDKLEKALVDKICLRIETKVGLCRSLPSLFGARVDCSVIRSTGRQRSATICCGRPTKEFVI